MKPAVIIIKLANKAFNGIEFLLHIHGDFKNFDSLGFNISIKLVEVAC